MCAVVFVRCFKKIGACRRRFSVLPSPGWSSSKTPSWRPEQSTPTPTQVAKRKSVIWKSWGWLCGLHSQQRQVKDFWWTSKKNWCIGYNPLIRRTTQTLKNITLSMTPLISRLKKTFSVLMSRLLIASIINMFIPV